MKPNFLSKYFLLFILGMTFSLNSFSQSCANDAGTNPDSPSNNDPLFTTWDNLWLNAFDVGKNNGTIFSLVKLNPSAGWTDSGLNDVDTLKMFNPFSIGATPNAPHLTIPAADFTKRDFHWEDGWELLYLGTGFYPNGDPINTVPVNSWIDESQQVQNGQVPYMIYYNRYSAMIRVFLGVFVPFGSAQNLTVDLGLNESVDNLIDPLPYNGILRHLNAYDSPLDQQTLVSQQRGDNTTGLDFNIRKWYVFDFQVGYDPCICQNPSVLDLDISLVEESTMSLYGRMITLEEPLADAQGNPIYNQDFLSASSISEQDENGYLLKSSLDGLIEDYRTSLQTYENALEDRQFGRSGWFRDVLGDLQSTIVGAGVDLIPGGEIAQWVVKKKLNLGADSADVEKLVKSGGKSLLSGGYNFLSNQIFGENVNPVRPTRPVANFSEMRLEGKIDKTNTTSLNGFLTPGSNMDGMEITALNYPAYNEVLGLYATLRTPEVEYLELPGVATTATLSIETELDSTWNIGAFPSPCFVNFDGYHLDSTVTKVRTQSQDVFVKMKNPLSYALNPAVDINMEKTQVYLSYVITLANGDVVAQPFGSNGYTLLDSLVVEEDPNTNLWLLHDISQSQNAFKKGTDRKLTLSAGWFEVENTTNLLFGSTLNTSLYYRERHEQFTPVCGGSPDFNSFVPNILSSAMVFKPVKIEVKVMADMYFDQLSYTGEEINTTQTFTYLLLDTEQGIDLIDDQGNYVLPNEANEFIQMFPGELTIESEVISGTSPEAFPNNENFVVTVRAENIVIDKPLSGFIIVSPSTGPLVKVQAYDGIHIKPGAHLRRNLNLQINKDVYGAPVSLPASEPELDGFCSSASYQAADFQARHAPSISNVEAENTLSEFYERQANEISVYPNPARSELTLRATGGGLGQITIYDTSGRPVMQANAGGGASEHRIDIGALAPGIYIVQAACGDEVHSEKLVVAR